MRNDRIPKFEIEHCCLPPYHLSRPLVTIMARTIIPLLLQFMVPFVLAEDTLDQGISQLAYEGQASLKDNQSHIKSQSQPSRGITLDDIYIAHDASGNQKCCPLGTIFSGRDCIFPESRICPSGLVLIDNACVTLEPPACPPGLAFRGNGCISTESPSCPPGSVFNGKLCVSARNPACPPGLSYNGVNCVSSAKPTCPPGTIFDGRTYVSDARPGCPPGTTFDGERALQMIGPVVLLGRPSMETPVCLLPRLPVPRVPSLMAPSVSLLPPRPVRLVSPW